MLQIDFTPFPALETERLQLRRIEQEDAHQLFLLRSDKNIMHFIQHRLARSPEDIQDFIRRVHELQHEKSGVHWAMCLKGNATVKGIISMFQIQHAHYRAELGYMLHPKLQGRGIMQEAIDAVLAYAFQTMGLHSVEAHVNPANIASVKRLEYTGFIREGLFKENFCHEGVFSDTAVFSLLKKNSRFA